MATTSVAAGTNLAAIFARAIHLEEADLPPEAARAVLGFAFPESDHQRLHELAQKNQQGRLTSQEDAEMSNYLCVGNLMSLLQSKARKSLKNAGCEA